VREGEIGGVRRGVRGERRDVCWEGRGRGAIMGGGRGSGDKWGRV